MEKKTIKVAPNEYIIPIRLEEENENETQGPSTEHKTTKNIKIVMEAEQSTESLNGQNGNGNTAELEVKSKATWAQVASSSKSPPASSEHTGTGDVKGANCGEIVKTGTNQSNVTDKSDTKAAKNYHVRFDAATTEIPCEIVTRNLEKLNIEEIKAKGITEAKPPSFEDSMVGKRCLSPKDAIPNNESSMKMLKTEEQAKAKSMDIDVGNAAAQSPPELPMKGNIATNYPLMKALIDFLNISLSNLYRFVLEMKLSPESKDLLANILDTVQKIPQKDTMSHEELLKHLEVPSDESQSKDEKMNMRIQMATNMLKKILQIKEAEGKPPLVAKALTPMPPLGLPPKPWQRAGGSSPQPPYGLPPKPWEKPGPSTSKGAIPKRRVVPHPTGGRNYIIKPLPSEPKDQDLWKNYRNFVERNTLPLNYNLPTINIREKIVIAIDRAHDEEFTPFLADNNHYKPIQMIKKAVNIFLTLKHRLDQRHEFAVVVLNENNAHWIHNFTSNIPRLKHLVNSITECAAEDVFDLTTLFEELSQNIILPVPKVDSHLLPPHLVRCILFYGRSYTLPALKLNERIEEFLHHPYFLCDVLMTHEPVSAGNHCAKIFKLFKTVDVKNLAYFFPVSRDVHRLNGAIGKLLGHPLQRPLQKKQIFEEQEEMEEVSQEAKV